MFFYYLNSSISSQQASHMVPYCSNCSTPRCHASSLLLQAYTHETPWFVVLFLLWRSKELGSVRWGDRRWSRQPWPFPQTSDGRTHKRTAKHDHTQTMTTPSQEAWVKLRFPLCVFKNPQMTITEDLINWEGGVDSPGFSPRAGVSSFTSCHLYGQRKAGGVPLLLSWGLGPDFKRCSPA